MSDGLTAEERMMVDDLTLAVLRRSEELQTSKPASHDAIVASHIALAQAIVEMVVAGWKADAVRRAEEQGE